MKKYKILLTISALTLGWANLASAAVPVPYGWYLEGNVGVSKEQNKKYPGPGTVKNTGFGWNVNAGYKFTPFVAAEIGYTHYADALIKNSAGTQAARDKHFSYDIAAKLMLPIAASGLELFAKVGAVRMNSNVTVTNAAAAAVNGLTFNTGTHTATNIYYGGGAEYAFTPYLLANAQWVRAKGSRATGDGDLYSLGLSYLFC